MRRSGRQRLGAFFDDALGDFQPERRLRFQRTMDALERFAAGPLHVLDAGCGEGLFAVELARRHPRWTIIGVDTNEEMLRRARLRAKRRRLGNISFRHADLTGPFGSGEYDAVVAIQCLVEIRDDEAALRSLASALRPGGLLLADVPERNWVPVLPGSARTWRHEVRHGYGTDELTEKLSACRLRVEKIVPASRTTVRLAQEVRDRLKDRRLRARALALPLLAVAVPLERLGVTWGPPRSLFVAARRVDGAA